MEDICNVALRLWWSSSLFGQVGTIYAGFGAESTIVKLCTGMARPLDRGCDLFSYTVDEYASDEDVTSISVYVPELVISSKVRMLEFMDYIQRAFHKASKWNPDNSYSNLTATSRGQHMRSSHNDIPR